MKKSDTINNIIFKYIDFFPSKLEDRKYKVTLKPVRIDYNKTSFELVLQDIKFGPYNNLTEDIEKSMWRLENVIQMEDKARVLNLEYLDDKQYLKQIEEWIK